MSFLLQICRSVIYKEQVRLNQAAANALMARLEAQKAICDASEKDLHKIHKQKEEIEREIRPERNQVRKRMRIADDLLLDEQQDPKSMIYLPSNSELGASREEEPQESSKPPNPDQVEEELGGDSRKQRGQQNVEKWLQMLLEDDSPDELLETSDEIVNRMNLKYPHKEEEERKSSDLIEKHEIVHTVEAAEPPKLSFEKKGKGLVRSESARILRRIPSSPSILLKKGVNFIRKKKPAVFSDYEGNSNRLFRSPFKTTKKTAAKTL